MKIHLAPSAGFCFGVKRAIDIALDSAKSRKNVRMLGDIVHNEDVIAKIKERGVKKIKTLKTEGRFASLLIRAHGAGRKTYETAARLGYDLIDATCPMVKEIHRIAADREKKGRRIIVIGDKKHDEVLGIVGQLRKKTYVIDRPAGIPWKDLGRLRRVAVVVQSTQNLENALEIVRLLKQRIPDLEFLNTICGPTRSKQNDIKVMPKKNDVMIVIGSRTSANTRRLYEISKSLNSRTFWVQSKDDVRPLWFRGAKSVGVTAGASTPDDTTKAVIEAIRRAARQKHA